MHVVTCMYMPLYSCVCSRVAYAYVKPNLSAYAIHMVPHLRNWLFRPYTVFIHINYTATCACCHKRTVQSVHARVSVHDKNYNSRNLRNPDQFAQPSAARSVFLNNSGNMCRIELACAAIYSLRFSCSDSDTFLLLGIEQKNLQTIK